MAITFTPIDDKDIGPYRVVRDRNGISGSRYGIVNTDDPIRALNASGLPPWNSLYPNGAETRVLRIEVERLGGTDPTGLGDGATSLLRIDFGTPEGGSIAYRPPGAPNEAWTDVQTNVTTITVYDSNETPPQLIANGDGAAKTVGELTLLVTTFYPLSGAGFDFLRHASLTRNQNVNDAPITVPKLYGTNLSQSFTAGQLQYRGFVPRRNESVLEVQHTLVVGDETNGHKTAWRNFNERGIPQGSIVYAPMYEPASFNGLWPV